MNYIYERLREENKIYEIKEDLIIKKQNQNTSRENLNSNANSDVKSLRKSKSINYNSGASNSNNPTYSNPLVVFKVKNEKKDEDYWIAKNYIKMLRQSEFYMI